MQGFYDVTDVVGLEEVDQDSPCPEVRFLWSPTAMISSVKPPSFQTVASRLSTKVSNVPRANGSGQNHPMRRAAHTADERRIGSRGERHGEWVAGRGVRNLRTGAFTPYARFPKVRSRFAMPSSAYPCAPGVRRPYATSSSSLQRA